MRGRAGDKREDVGEAHAVRSQIRQERRWQEFHAEVTPVADNGGHVQLVRFREAEEGPEFRELDYTTMGEQRSASIPIGSYLLIMRFRSMFWGKQKFRYNRFLFVQLISKLTSGKTVNHLN